MVSSAGAESSSSRAELPQGSRLSLGTPGWPLGVWALGRARCTPSSAAPGSLFSTFIPTKLHHPSSLPTSQVPPGPVSLPSCSGSLQDAQFWPVCPWQVALSLPGVHGTSTPRPPASPQGCSPLQLWVCEPGLLSAPCGMGIRLWKLLGAGWALHSSHLPVLVPPGTR